MVAVSPAPTRMVMVSRMLNCGLYSVTWCVPGVTRYEICGVLRPVSSPSTMILLHGRLLMRR